MANYGRFPIRSAEEAAELISHGPSAIPALRQVCNDLDDVVAAEFAGQCLEWVEGKRRTELPVAAARLLAIARPAEATAVLLGYLPYADDQSVVDAVAQALTTLAKESTKPDTALIAALILGLVNAFIRPILIIITLPINIVTLGLFTFVINGLLFWFVASFVKCFEVGGFWSAFFGALAYSVISTFLSVLLAGE